MYVERMNRNLRPVIEAQGYVLLLKDKWPLKSIGWRHFWDIERGRAGIRLATLEAVADEVGVDMLAFFAE